MDSATLRRLRDLVDPTGHGVPRRAVLAGPGRLAVDKSRAPDQPEVDVISEICHLCFQTEPRHAVELMDRALVQDLPDAWTALRDDLVWGYPVPVCQDHVPHIVAALYRPSECRVFVCAKLIASSDDAVCWSSLEDSFEDVLRHVTTVDSEVAASAFQEVVARLGIDAAVVAECLCQHPASAKMFLGLCHADLLGVARAAPHLADVLETHARSLPAGKRYPTLAFLATLAHAGVRVGKPQLGVDTLVELRRQKYDVRLAAAAAVLAQTHDDPTVAALVHAVESLACTLQKINPSEGSRGPAN